MARAGGSAGEMPHERAEDDRTLMPRLTIDREKLRTRVRWEPPENLLMLLDRAIDLLPASKLAAFIEGHYLPEEVAANDTPPPGLLETAQAFDAASRRGEYYEDFAVNSRNCSAMSRGTQRWMAECHRLLDWAVERATKQPDAEVRQTFELIIGLLDRIDDCMDDIVFFADEGGSWQIGVDWLAVLPAYARCLALTDPPEAFATALLSLVERHGSYQTKRILPAIRKVASKEQAAEFARRAKASSRLS